MSGEVVARGGAWQGVGDTLFPPSSHTHTHTHTQTHGWLTVSDPLVTKCNECYAPSLEVNEMGVGSMVGGGRAWHPQNAFASDVRKRKI